MAIERTKITFSPNVPVGVKLDYADAREGSNKNGAYFQYTLNDDSAVMFLTPAAHNILQRTGARAGDLVQITKVQHGSNGATWDIRVMSDAAEPAPAPRQAPGPRMVAPVQRTPGPEFPNKLKDGMTTTQGATALAPKPQFIVDHNLMARYFVLSGRALQQAHAQLVSENLPDIDLNPPTWEDVRAAGISLFIEHYRENERRLKGSR